MWPILEWRWTYCFCQWQGIILMQQHLYYEQELKNQFSIIDDFKIRCWDRATRKGLHRRRSLLGNQLWPIDSSYQNRSFGWQWSKFNLTLLNISKRCKNRLFFPGMREINFCTRARSNFIWTQVRQFAWKACNLVWHLWILRRLIRFRQYK